ncbi:MAG: hypothetical protein IPH62_05205 [Ignavibacteriae bacterium]|nr:hypothetical protein [Ignavibacteriota bacterium]
MKLKFLYVPIVILILIIIFILPIKINTSITANGKLLPSKVWIISKGLEGLLYTTLVDNVNGFNEEYSITQFARGDLIKFSLNKNIKPGKKIFINDTIGIVYSSLNEQEIATLKGELDAAKASLQIGISGEKESLIELENKNLDYAKKQVEEQTKFFVRQKKLFEKQLITQDEYETENARLELYKINISIAEERLRSVLTGTKKEELQLINSQIKSLENQITVLQNKSNNLLLKSTINGIVSASYNQDTLLIINSENKFTALIPIKLNLANSFNAGNEVEIIPRNGNSILAKIESVDKSVKIFLGEQFIIAKTVFESSSDTFYTNEIVECKISGNEVNLLDYIMFYLKK